MAIVVLSATQLLLVTSCVWGDGVDTWWWVVDGGNMMRPILCFIRVDPLLLGSVVFCGCLETMGLFCGYERDPPGSVESWAGVYGF